MKPEQAGSRQVNKIHSAKFKDDAKYFNKFLGTRQSDSRTALQGKLSCHEIERDVFS